MAEADVLVLQDEEADNLFQDGEGEEWPEEGMTCPITGCTGSGHHFKTVPILTDFISQIFSSSLVQFVKLKTPGDPKLLGTSRNIIKVKLYRIFHPKKSKLVNS